MGQSSAQALASSESLARKAAVGGFGNHRSRRSLWHGDGPALLHEFDTGLDDRPLWARLLIRPSSVLSHRYGTVLSSVRLLHRHPPGCATACVTDERDQRSTHGVVTVESQNQLPGLVYLLGDL